MVATMLGYRITIKDAGGIRDVHGSGLLSLLIESAPIGNVPLYSQRDPLWRRDQLGYGGTTIGSYGCTVTGFAGGVSSMLGREITPAMVNNEMKRVGGFTGSNKNLFIWSKAPVAFPEIVLHSLVHCVTTPAPVDQIDVGLEAGNIILARIDFNLSVSGIQPHWLRIIGGDKHDGYVCHDPWPLPEGQAPIAVPPKYAHTNWNAARAIYSVAQYRKS